MKIQMKKFICAVILICVLSGFASTPIHVSAADYEQIECVILLDVSGSMGWIGQDYGSDPQREDGTRVSIEAIKAFINNCPSYIDMKISIVVYNHECVKVTENPINILTNGTDLIKRDLEKILKNQIDGITCWSGMTDIAKPLEEARKILDKNTGASVKKGVLLFTDGKIEIYDENSKRDEKKEKNSSDKCKTIVENFKKDGINFYSIGLNGGDSAGNGSIDREFLDDLGVRIDKPPYIVDTVTGENLDKLIDYFLDVYVDLIGAQKKVSEDIPIIGARQEQSFNIYGDITREVNISITSGKQLTSMQVYYDNKDVTSSNDISVSMEKMSTTVKIINPDDGDWKIIFQGTAGDSAKMTQIHLYDLSMKCVRDSDIFKVYLFNEFKKQKVTLPRIYKESLFKPKLIDKYDNEHDIGWKMDEEENGYEVNVSELRKKMEPGLYSTKFELEKEGYFTHIYYSYNEIEIKLPEIKSTRLWTSSEDSPITAGDKVTFYLELLDESKNTITSLYPDIKVILSVRGEDYEMKYSVSDMYYQCDVIFEAEGSYPVAVAVDLPDDGGTLTDDAADVKIEPLPPPEIKTIRLKTEKGRTQYTEGDNITFQTELLDDDGNLITSHYPDLNVILQIGGSKYDMTYTMSESPRYEHVIAIDVEGDYLAVASIDLSDIQSSDPVDFTIIPKLEFRDFMWVIFLIAGFVILIFIIWLLMQKANHEIGIVNGQKITKITVKYKNPLIITTDENRNAKNKYVMIVSADSVFRDTNLAKIETYGALPFPIFHRSIRVVKEVNSDIELEQKPPDKIIAAPNDIELIFKNTYSPNDVLKLKFHYEIKRTQSNKKIKKDEFDIE